MTVKRTRRVVPYVKVLASLHRHPKRERTLFGCAADGVLVRALSYARDHESDGYVPDWWVAEQTEPRNRKKLRAELVKPRPPHNRPLFEEADGGLLVHDYLDVNESHDELEERRRGWAGQKQTQRNRDRQQTFEDGRSVHPENPPDALGVRGEEEQPSTEEQPQSPARALVEQGLAAFRESGLPFDLVSLEIGIGNAIGAYPDKDVVRACRELVAWLLGPKSPPADEVNPNSALMTFLSKQTAAEDTPGAGEAEKRYRPSMRECPFDECGGSGWVEAEDSDDMVPCRCHPSVSGAAA